MYKLSEDPEFAFILEETLSLSNNFGASTGEVLRAASQIKPGDFESWYSEFKFLADAIHDQADAINATRYPVSAREAYFRSATYYRSADFFLHGNISDPRIYTLWDSAIADFDKAIALLPKPAERVNLTATNFTVPAIFYPGHDQSAASSHEGQATAKRCNAAKRPTIIVGNGFDDSQEESYHMLGRSIIDRGWNFVSYEGPGQPTVRRQQDIGFVPNWWDAVTPTMDYLAERDDVDMDRVALVGISFGGSLAPIAASREHRLSAVITLDGLLSLFNASMAQFPDVVVDLYHSGDGAKFDKFILEAVSKNTTDARFRWVVTQGMFAFNTRSPSEWLNKVREFDITSDLLANVTCPVFVAEGDNDSLGNTQAAQMAKMLGKKATYNLFKKELGAGEHCQIGAEAQVAQVTMDWLDEVWQGVPVSKNNTDAVV